MITVRLWGALMARGKTVSIGTTSYRQAFDRIRAEYQEMPGMRLTLPAGGALVGSGGVHLQARSRRPRTGEVPPGRIRRYLPACDRTGSRRPQRGGP